MFGSNVPSIPVTAPIMGMGGNGYGNDGWGGGWWVLIILFALFGWGRGGWGAQNGNGGDCCCGQNALSADIQRGFDNQGVMNKLNGLENGICSLGYDQLAQMNGINQNISTTGFGIQNAITQMGINNMQDTNALSRQLADCCCENRAAIAQVRYDMATSTCATQNTIQNTARDIMDNDNANWRALNDRLTQMEINGYKERIAEQQSLINSLNLAQSQANQNAYLISELRPTAKPAFLTCNPYSGAWGYPQSQCQHQNNCCNQGSVCCG